MLRLTGTIIVEDGVYLSECCELNISTCAASLDACLQDTLEMILAYFAASAKMGTLQDELGHLVSGIQLNSGALDLETDFALPVGGLHAVGTRRIDLPRLA